MSLSQLIGVPFRAGGRDLLTGCDCISLAVIAQRMLFSRNINFPEYDFDNYIQESKRMEKYFKEIYKMQLVEKKPEPGDWGILKLRKCNHLFTFIKPDLALHISEGATSRITRIKHYKDFRVFRFEGGGI